MVTKSKGYHDAFGIQRHKRRERQPKPRRTQWMRVMEARRKVEEVNKAASAKALRQYLIIKYSSGDFPATYVAALAFYISKCGVPGFKDLATDPNSLEFARHCSRKVSDALGIPQLKANLIQLALPCSSLNSADRTIEKYPVRCLQSTLIEEFEHNAASICRASQELDTPNWLNHKGRQAALEAGDLPIAFGLFEDAAAWKGKGAGTRGSIHCVYVSFVGLNNAPRHAIAVINKSRFCGEECGCSCKGRCTMMVLHHYLKWGVTASAQGIWPSHSWDGQLLDNSMAGSPALVHCGKRVRFFLIEIRADWDQISGGYGCPRTNQFFFCPKCRCPHSAMHGPMNHEMYTHEVYLQEVNDCRHIVVVGPADLERILGSISVDTRNEGVHGRALNKALSVYDHKTKSAVALEKFDRLEIGGCIMDTYWSAAAVRAHSPGSRYELHFWRHNRAHPSNRFQFCSPLLEAEWVRFEYIMIGILHTLDLGVTSRLAGFSMVAALKAGDVFSNTADMRGMALGCRRLTKALRQYSRHRAGLAHACGRKRDRSCGRVTLKMLQFFNLKSKGHLKVKGGEATNILPFVHTLLRRSSLVPKRRELLKATHALLRAYRLMRAGGKRIQADDLESLLDVVFTNCKAAGVPLIPKFHLMRHLGDLTRSAGNPACFSEYFDEDHNRVMVRLAQAASTPKFEAAILVREQLYSRAMNGRI